MYRRIFLLLTTTFLFIGHSETLDIDCKDVLTLDMDAMSKYVQGMESEADPKLQKQITQMRNELDDLQSFRYQCIFTIAIDIDGAEDAQIETDADLFYSFNVVDVDELDITPDGIGRFIDDANSMVKTLGLQRKYDNEYFNIHPTVSISFKKLTDGFNDYVNDHRVIFGVDNDYIYISTSDELRAYSMTSKRNNKVEYLWSQNAKEIGCVVPFGIHSINDNILFYCARNSDGYTIYNLSRSTGEMKNSYIIKGVQVPNYSRPVRYKNYSFIVTPRGVEIINIPDVLYGSGGKHLPKRRLVKYIDAIQVMHSGTDIYGYTPKITDGVLYINRGDTILTMSLEDISSIEDFKILTAVEDDFENSAGRPVGSLAFGENAKYKISYTNINGSIFALSDDGSVYKNIRGLASLSKPIILNNRIYIYEPAYKSLISMESDLSGYYWFKEISGTRLIHLDTAYNMLFAFTDSGSIYTIDINNGLNIKNANWISEYPIKTATHLFEYMDKKCVINSIDIALYCLV